MTATSPQKVPCTSSYYSTDMTLANKPGPGGLELFPWAKVKLNYFLLSGTTRLQQLHCLGLGCPSIGPRAQISPRLSGALRGLGQDLVQPVVPAEMAWDHTSTACAWSHSTLPDRPPHLTSVTKIKSSCLLFQKVFQLYGL